jgi:cytochrome c
MKVADMMRTMLLLVLLGLLVACSKQDEPPAVPATNPKDVADSLTGADLFAVACQACHSIALEAPHRVGPNLYGIFDQPAASRAGFNYSPALQQSAISWNRANLIAWVVAPEVLVPGTWMLYHNTLEADELPRLIEYLERAATASQP